MKRKSTNSAAAPAASTPASESQSLKQATTAAALTTSPISGGNFPKPCYLVESSLSLIQTSFFVSQRSSSLHGVYESFDEANTQAREIFVGQNPWAVPREKFSAKGEYTASSTKCFSTVEETNEGGKEFRLDWDGPKWTVAIRKTFFSFNRSTTAATASPKEQMNVATLTTVNSTTTTNSKYFPPIQSAATAAADSKKDVDEDEPMEEVKEAIKEDDVDQEEDEEEQPLKKKPKKAAATSTKKKEAAAASSTSSSSAISKTALLSAPTVRASPSVLSFDDTLLQQPMESYSATFDRIARDLMLNYELYSNGEWLRVLEIEFYWKGDEQKAPLPSHHDLFAHGHPVQRDSFGKWYFHRQGTKPDASFKGGNYKGADVTFGAKSGGGYGGILIRSVQRISDGTIIEGSCLVADELLRHHKADSLVDLHASWKGNTCAFTNPTLFFTPAQHKLSYKSGEPIMIKSPRVGLTLKQEGESRPKYLMQPYRYSMLPFFNKKMKQTIALSVYEELGKSQLSTIRNLCSCTSAYLDKLIDCYESGRKLGSMDKFIKNNKAALSVDEFSQLYGAWMSVYGTKPYRAILRAP